MQDQTAANFPDGEWCSLLWPLPAHRQKYLAATQGLLATVEANEFYQELALHMTSIDPDAAQNLEKLLHHGKSSTPVHDQTLLAKEVDDVPLTIVTVSRNDTHVERMEERTQAFIDGLLHQAETHEQRIELIIVEWNPPSGRPSMAEAFRFPASHPYASVKIVTIPSDLHNHFAYASRLPLYQMIGKNVGIRRARGSIILATNIDVLLSDELFAVISSGMLHSGKHYRSDRWDIDRSVLDLSSPSSRLQQARSLCLGVNTRHGCIPKAAVDIDRVEIGPAANTPYIPHLHTVACGDFQLLHRDDWALLRGYPELDSFSMHLDTMFAMQCHAFGLVEHTFASKMPHYHIDHTLGVQVKAASYFTQEKQELKHVSLGNIVAMTETMLTSGKPLCLNNEDWGLINHDIPDTCVTLGEWDTPLSSTRRNIKFANSTVGSSLVSLHDFEHWGSQALLPALDASMRHVCTTAIRIAGGRRLRIWGRGARGTAICAYFAKVQHPIDCFIDGTLASGARETFRNYPVRSPFDVLSTSEPPDSRAFVIVASSYIDEIEPTLHKAGYIEGSDYLLGL
ncbi:hypothetical protein [Gimibacter soli]|uniref:Uncharacterized protein n=1 Tax=Gimibacter soli TaxID=3024400 RepID=A0AAF0BL56_9PROT|nr:hypothetical protein [Gimibacter soli]WCL53055.1 hypothetical protein PH603_10940 [Gimibacter soli]